MIRKTQKFTKTPTIWSRLMIWLRLQRKETKAEYLRRTGIVEVYPFCPEHFGAS